VGNAGVSEPAFTFLRAEWLWGFLPLLALAIRQRRRRSSGGSWTRVVDPALAPYVIESEARTARSGVAGLFVAWAVMLLILAGPVFERRPVPVFEARRVQVILFDLSRSMLATDVAPDRVTRARYKLGDLLRRADGTRTGLIAFAERPYVVSPLTEDASTLAAFLPSLDPSIVPAQGSRLDLALARALAVLEQGGGEAGQLILITDAEVDERGIAMAREVAARGHVLSVLGVGTAAGVPLREPDGTFLRRADGAIAVPQLDLPALDELARLAGGEAVALTSDTQDLDTIERLRTGARPADDAASTERAELWIERVPWLLPPLLLAALLLFRRGVIA